jgi:sigma-B regulation protein RsbU (phosphoserine phosphatase)
MLTVFLRSAINKKFLSPSAALKVLFREFNHNNFDHGLYITVFYAIINTKDKIISYSNAGHNVPPLVSRKGRFVLLRSGLPIRHWT